MSQSSLAADLAAFQKSVSILNIALQPLMHSGTTLSFCHPQHLPQSPPSPPSRHGDCSRAPLATVREPRTLIPIFICLSRLFDLQPFLPHPLSPEASSPRRPQRMNDVICALDLTGPSYQAISGNARCVPTGKNTPSLPAPGELGRVHGCPRTRHSGTFSDHGGLSRVPPTCDH